VGVLVAITEDNDAAKGGINVENVLSMAAQRTSLGFYKYFNLLDEVAAVDDDTIILDVVVICIVVGTCLVVIICSVVDTCLVVVVGTIVE